MSVPVLTEPARSMHGLYVDGNEPTLDHVAGVIAMLAEPAGSIDSVVAALDALAERAASSSNDPVDNPEGLLRYLHGDLAFRGNAEDYYNPDNSYLHLVIERRLGIPITLATVAVEVGRRLDIGLVPIGFPGHLLLGDLGTPDRFYDPFAGGPVLNLDGCRSLLQGMFPGASLEDAHTEPLPVSHVAHRMLNNLKQIHLRSGNLSALADAAAIGVTLPGADVGLITELAKVAEAVGRVDHAAALHDHLAGLEVGDADKHSDYAAKLRFRSN